MALQQEPSARLIQTVHDANRLVMPGLDPIINGAV
jgi:hypothetical protein